MLRKVGKPISLYPEAAFLNALIIWPFYIFPSENSLSLVWTRFEALAKVINFPRFIVWHLWLMLSNVKLGPTFCCCLQ